MITGHRAKAHIQRIRIRHIFLVCALAFMLISSAQSLYAIIQKGDFVSRRERVLGELEAENDELKRAYGQTQTPEFIERQAREKLGYAKPGETVLIFDMPAPPDSGETEEEDALSNWKKWLNLFL